MLNSLKNIKKIMSNYVVKHNQHHEAIKRYDEGVILELTKDTSELIDDSAQTYTSEEDGKTYQLMFTAYERLTDRFVRVIPPRDYKGIPNYNQFLDVLNSLMKPIESKEVLTEEDGLKGTVESEEIVSKEIPCVSENCEGIESEVLSKEIKIRALVKELASVTNITAEDLYFNLGIAYQKTLSE